MERNHGVLEMRKSRVISAGPERDGGSWREYDMSVLRMENLCFHKCHSQSVAVLVLRRRALTAAGLAVLGYKSQLSPQPFYTFNLVTRKKVFLIFQTFFS